MNEKYCVQAFTLSRIFLGLVFLSAGLYRLFSFQYALNEFSNIVQGFEYPMLVITLIIEIGGGVMLLGNIKTPLVSLSFIIFLVMALALVLAPSWQTISTNLSELFTLDKTPTDLFLHLSYMIMFLTLFLSSRASGH